MVLFHGNGAAPRKGGGASDERRWYSGETARESGWGISGPAQAQGTPARCGRGARTSYGFREVRPAAEKKQRCRVAYLAFLSEDAPMRVSLFPRRGRRFPHPGRNRRTCALRVEVLEERTLLSYSFQPIAFIPGPAPGGGSFINDFEPGAGAINDRGKLTFVADVDTGGEGIFTKSPGGPLTQIVRSGQPAPGGGTFDFFGVLGHVALNNHGDGAFAF